ncbi:T9SS type A sorting domain-containing protein [Taibaiella lutea]|nr:T9SS type A sorting domain-containing protein [Taibaiella lutea]
MKKLKLLVIIGILFSSILSSFLHAQTEGITNDEWLQQMKIEEQKITAYVNEQMKNVTLNDSLKRSFLISEKHDEISKADLPKFADKYVQDYYRKKYFELHPDTQKIYNPGRVATDQKNNAKPGDESAISIQCSEGNFESGIGASFHGYESPVNYNGFLCNFIPTTNVAYTNIGFGNPDDFLLTNNAPDPIIPSLNQTHNYSNHAIRINASTPCWRDNGLDMLQKSFSSSVSGTARINFSYALVLEKPDDGNPFFVARVLNNLGVEVGTRICKHPNSIDPLIQTVIANVPGCEQGYPVSWRDWGCDFIEFDIAANKTYTIEFFVADCGGGGHFGYAYVDDICTDVLCCDASKPVNLRCTPSINGSQLSWDPVPGVSYYKLIRNQYDPSCCEGPHPPNPISTVDNVSLTNFFVPDSYAHCFSWSVVAVMPDRCEATSFKMCSCTPPPPPPDSLDCNASAGGNMLSWTPIPGAAYYKVVLNQYDPGCCDTSPIPYPISAVWTSYSSNVFVPYSFAYCFSWWVTAIMSDSSSSERSEKKCSCVQMPPTGLNCFPNYMNGSYGSVISWNPVAGAVSYKVFYIKNDPLCCPGTSPTSGMITTTSTSGFVPSTIAACFSWRVVAVMANGTESISSETKCSCTKTGGKPGRNEDEPKTTEGKTTIGKNIFATAIPNPASEYIEFEVHNKDNQMGTNSFTLYLYDMSGREVFNKEITDNNKLRVDIQPYLNGIYIYEIRSNDKSLFKDKVVIKKH